MRTLLLILVITATMGAKPVAGPASKPTTKPATEIRAVEQLVREIPKNQRPPKGQDWDGIGAKLAARWVAEHAAGRAFHGPLKLTSSDIRDNGSVVIHSSHEFDFGSTSEGEARITASFPAKFVEQFRKLRDGEFVIVAGTIKSAEFSRQGSFMVLDVEIQDCVLR